MRVKLIPIAIVFALALFSARQANAQSEKKMSEQTLQNLSTAMHGEAFAYAKYTAFSEHARKTGNAELADLLEKAAKTERFEHFAEEAELAGLVGSNAENLKDAIKGESYETETMYREFAQQAEKAGDHAAAQRFEEIRQDEAKHRDAFLAALQSLEQKGHGGSH
jgi:rubrerythrin